MPRSCATSGGSDAVESVTTDGPSPTCAEGYRRRRSDDDVDQLRRAHDHRAVRRPRRSRGRRPGRPSPAASRSASLIVGRDLQPRPDLALHLDDRGHRVLDQQRLVDRPASRPAPPRAGGPAAPTSPRRCTAPPATAGSPPPRWPRAPPGRPDRSRSRSPCGWRSPAPSSRATITLNRWLSTSCSASRSGPVRSTLRSATSPVGRVGARRGRHVAAQPPGALQEPHRPARRHVGPVDVVLGRAREDQGQPHRVHAVRR